MKTQKTEIEITFATRRGRAAGAAIKADTAVECALHQLQNGTNDEAMKQALEKIAAAKLLIAESIELLMSR
jgi:hypothetical protein